MSLDAEIAGAAAVLRRGGLVAFPTETVYGLGARAADRAALRRLYAVKRRPLGHPVILHVPEGAPLADWAEAVPGPARTLADACWPGPLTLVLRRRADRVPDEVTGGRDTVGLRVPGHPVALRLLEALGGAVAAPSANRFGRVSPTTAADVRADLGDDVDAILDGGPCAVGLESTIVDCSGAAPVILRPGGVARERVEEMVGGPVAVRLDATGGAPGTLPVHYAPRARVLVVPPEEAAAVAAEVVDCGAAVGLLAEKPVDGLHPGVLVLDAPRDADDYARVLYARLREADGRGLEVVVAVAPSEVGIGTAVADRLRRASGDSGA